MKCPKCGRYIESNCEDSIKHDKEFHPVPVKGEGKVEYVQCKTCKLDGKCRVNRNDLRWEDGDCTSWEAKPTPTPPESVGVSKILEDLIQRVEECITGIKVANIGTEYDTCLCNKALAEKQITELLLTSERRGYERGLKRAIDITGMALLTENTNSPRILANRIKMLIEQDIAGTLGSNTATFVETPTSNTLAKCPKSDTSEKGDR